MSYSGDPASSLTDEIRFLTHDVSNDPTTELLSDDEIAYVIAELSGTYTDALMYAAYCADRIADTFAGEVAINADGVSISAEQLQDKYRAMAVSLRQTYATRAGVGAGPYAGGSVIDEHVWGARPYTFGLAMHDNAWAGRQDEDRDYDARADGSWP